MNIFDEIMTDDGVSMLTLAKVMAKIILELPLLVLVGIGMLIYASGSLLAGSCKRGIQAIENLIK